MLCNHMLHSPVITEQAKPSLASVSKETCLTTAGQEQRTLYSVHVL